MRLFKCLSVVCLFFCFLLLLLFVQAWFVCLFVSFFVSFCLIDYIHVCVLVYLFPEHCFVMPVCWIIYLQSIVFRSQERVSLAISGYLFPRTWKMGPARCSLCKTPVAMKSDKSTFTKSLGAMQSVEIRIVYTSISHCS